MLCFLGMKQSVVAFQLIKLNCMLKCQARDHYCKSLNKVDPAPYFYVTMAKAVDVTRKRHTVYKNWSLVKARAWMRVRVVWRVWQGRIQHFFKLLFYLVLIGAQGNCNRHIWEVLYRFVYIKMGRGVSSLFPYFHNLSLFLLNMCVIHILWIVSA